jgi:hypothetical protein
MLPLWELRIVRNRMRLTPNQAQQGEAKYRDPERNVKIVQWVAPGPLGILNLHAPSDDVL